MVRSSGAESYTTTSLIWKQPAHNFLTIKQDTIQRQLIIKT